MSSTRSTFFTSFEGVDRVAWQVGCGYERYEYTYLLADGTFVDGDGNVINLSEASAERVEHVLGNLRSIAAE